METENLLTLDQASERLNVALATVRAWVIRGQIDFIKLNGAIRFRPSDLSRMIDAGTRRSATRKTTDDKAQ